MGRLVLTAEAIIRDAANVAVTMAPTTTITMVAGTVWKAGGDGVKMMST